MKQTRTVLLIGLLFAAFSFALNFDSLAGKGGNGNGKGGGGGSGDGGFSTIFYSVDITDASGEPSVLFNHTEIPTRVGRIENDGGTMLINHISPADCATNGTIDLIDTDGLGPDEGLENHALSIDGDWEDCFPGQDWIDSFQSELTDVHEESGTMIITPRSDGTVEIELNFQALNKKGRQQGYDLIIDAVPDPLGSVYDPLDPDTCTHRLLLTTWDLFGNSGRLSTSCSGFGDFRTDPSNDESATLIITIKRDRADEDPCVASGCGD